MTLADAPLVGILGRPSWAELACAQLASGGFALVFYDGSADLMRRLIDECPALLLVDATAPGWQTHVTTIKVEQATRRLPVLVVAPTPDVGAAAQRAGAQGAVLVHELVTALVDRVRAQARVLDKETRHELDCQCQQELPPLARLGVERFNAGAYYAQHDAFEEQWMREAGPVRDLYRAILQVGVAYYHILRGNYSGGLKMLQRSVQWLALLPDVCQGVDVRQLREDSMQVRRALEAMLATSHTSFDHELLKPVPIISDSTPAF